MTINVDGTTEDDYQRRREQLRTIISVDGRIAELSVPNQAQKGKLQHRLFFGPHCSHPIKTSGHPSY